MGAAHAMKRIPLIKFPQRHPKPSGFLAIFFVLLFRIPFSSSIDDCAFVLFILFLSLFHDFIYLMCVNFAARLFNLERLSRNQRVSVSLERKKIREKNGTGKLKCDEEVMVSNDSLKKEKTENRLILRKETKMLVVPFWKC